MKETKCRPGEMERVIHSLFLVECWNSQKRGFENVRSGLWLDYHASSRFSLTWWINLHGRGEDGMIWKWLISSYVTRLASILKASSDVQLNAESNTLLLRNRFEILAFLDLSFAAAQKLAPFAHHHVQTHSQSHCNKSPSIKNLL